MAKRIKLGLFGLGTVGSGLVRIIENRKQELLDTHGIELEVPKAVVKNPQKRRACNMDGIQISTNPEDILKDDNITIAIELIGGIEPASSIIKGALQAGKAVVSANKALIADQGEALIKLANDKQLPFLAEASVGGGIPILKTLRESLVANEIGQLTAIINGTTNFILTKMEEEGLSYYETLKMASDLGFAEADPTMDVEGFDAQQKLRILAAHILNGTYPKGDILCEGITRITEHDFNFAKKHGFSIKLLAIARRHDETIELRVHPTLIPKLHPLASVRNEFNAVFLRGDAVGDVMLSGRGAGSLPTASAVYADIVDICTRTTTQNTADKTNKNALAILPANQIETEYYLCFTVSDKPGVIGEISTILGRYDISVSSVAAELIPNANGLGMLDIIVHKTAEKKLYPAIQEINQLSRIKGDGKFIRIERELF